MNYRPVRHLAGARYHPHLRLPLYYITKLRGLPSQPPTADTGNPMSTYACLTSIFVGGLTTIAAVSPATP